MHNIYLWSFFYLFILFSSLLLTGLIYRLTLKIGLLSTPNHRSSHIIPTPSGGGIGFIIIFLLSISLGFYWKLLSANFFFTITTTGLLLAVLGIFDDYKTLKPKTRLIGHVIASFLILYYLQGNLNIFIGSWLIPPIVANFLAFFYIIWLLNLYNFMDGINGIAAFETITVSSSGALLYFLNGQTAAMFVPLSLTFAVIGFLIWNFPKARIFMGDAGSGFLGIILGLFSLNAANFSSNLFWSWIILLGVFIVDTTFTLYQRARNHEKLSQAHCNHAYQHAARYYRSHVTVTLTIVAINILWLLPLATLVSLEYLNGSLGFIIAYCPLIILAHKFKAGKQQVTLCHSI